MRGLPNQLLLSKATIWRGVLFAFYIGILASTVYSQNYNPPYPRLVFQRPTEGNVGGSCEQFFSRYDCAIFYGASEKNEWIANQIRQINPSTIILAETKQGVWPGNDPPEFFMTKSLHTALTVATSGGETEIFVDSTSGFSSKANERYLIINGNDIVQYSGMTATSFTGIPTTGELAVDAHAQGEVVKTVIKFSGFGYLPNLTRFAPTVNGQTFWEYLVDKRFTKVDFSLYDGSFWDAFRARFWSEEIPDIDMDLNLINDQDEHGMTWINNEWASGVTNLLNYERQRMEAVNPGKPSIVAVNSGSMHGDSRDGTEYTLDITNGGMWEGFMRYTYDWDYIYQNMQVWTNRFTDPVNTPLIYLFEDYVKEEKLKTGKNDFSYMRFGLTTSLMGNAFYGRNFGDWYYISLWYDEFDINLGYPKGSPVKLANGAYVRIFDNGAAICNPTGDWVTVTASDVTSLPGAAPQYYRFLGGQDPSFNNGQLFDQVNLYGAVIDPNRPKKNRGDGIILLTQPDTVVADIFIGNCYNNDTSPGSSPIEFTGWWGAKKTFLNNPSLYNRCFSQWNESIYVYQLDAETHEDIGYHYTDPGDGSVYATYRPTIGVAGYYEISEWHSWLNETPSYSPEASNVPFEVVVDGVRKIAGIIDQTMNYNQWNRLAIIYLPAGTTSYVRINNKADNYIIADAMRFRFLGANVKADVDPPQAPRNVRILQY